MTSGDDEAEIGQPGMTKTGIPKHPQPYTLDGLLDQTYWWRDRLGRWVKIHKMNSGRSSTPRDSASSWPPRTTWARRSSGPSQRTTSSTPQHRSNHAMKRSALVAAIALTAFAVGLVAVVAFVGDDPAITYHERLRLANSGGWDKAS